MVGSRSPSKIERARELATCPRTATTTPPRTSRGTWRAASVSSSHLLENAEIVDPPADGVVGPAASSPSSTRATTTSSAERYLVGHIEERLGDLDVISPESPLGQALVGARAGEWVTYEAPNGELRVQVLKAETAESAFDAVVAARLGARRTTRSRHHP